jgi:rhodanese-related sulfurtransferase
MEIAALVVAVVALIVALSARAKAGGLARGVEEAERSARRTAENLAGEVEAEHAKLRRLLAEVAGGADVTPEMIAEGRLWRDLTAREAQAMLAAGELRLLDVRSPGETAGGVIPGAQLVPIEELEQRWREVPRGAQRTLVYCAMGSRSAAACEFLSQQGYSGLYNLEGGIGAWTGAIARP